MPVMDGYELFHELKKQNPELPIIVSSGFGEAEVTFRIGSDNIAGIGVYLLCVPDRAVSACSEGSFLHRVTPLYPLMMFISSSMPDVGFDSPDSFRCPSVCRGHYFPYPL